MKAQSVSHWRGHAIEQAHDGEWYYVDTGEAVAGSDRECGHCGERRTPEGHDPCIANLPGVMNACCGHGHDEPYIQLEGGLVLGGPAVRKMIQEAADQPAQETGT